MKLRRGEIWWADVPSDKRRPVVILTRSSVLERLTTVLVAPVTTRIRHIPTELALPGLHRVCVANLDNIVPLPRRVLVERIGQLGPAELDALCDAARFAIGC